MKARWSCDCRAVSTVDQVTRTFMPEVATRELTFAQAVAKRLRKRCAEIRGVCILARTLRKAGTPFKVL